MMRKPQHAERAKSLFTIQNKTDTKLVKSNRHSCPQVPDISVDQKARLVDANLDLDQEPCCICFLKSVWVLPCGHQICPDCMPVMSCSSPSSCAHATLLKNNKDTICVYCPLCDKE